MQASILSTYNKITLSVQRLHSGGRQGLNLRFDSESTNEYKNFIVSVDHVNKTAQLSGDNKTLLTLAGKTSFEEVDFIDADGDCIGCGSYRELPNMPAESSVGLNRNYSIYKDTSQGCLATLNQVHSSSTHKNIYLHVHQQNVDSLTRMLLIGKLVMLTLLDRGCLDLQNVRPQDVSCVNQMATDHLLPNFTLPSMSYPIRLRMRVVGSTPKENFKRDYFVLFDQAEKPWYIMETDNLKELKVLDPVTYQPLLLGDNAAGIGEKCTLTTASNDILGKLAGKHIYLFLEESFKKIYFPRIKNDKKQVNFEAYGDSRYKNGLVAITCHNNPRDDKEIFITIKVPPHRLCLALVLPILCIIASSHYKMKDMEVPACQSIEEVCQKLERNERK